MTFEVPTINQEYCEDQVARDTLTGHQEDLEFFIIQTLTGEVVKITFVLIPFELMLHPSNRVLN